MTAKPICLSNGHVFLTQTAARDHFSRMLARYTDEQIIDNPADYSDLCALLERYDAIRPESEPSKIGTGISHFIRRRNDFDGPWSSSGFWVSRTDGSATDFSYIQAVIGQPRRQDRDFNEACRITVAEDLARAKRAHFDAYSDELGRVECELTGELIDFADAHVDHVDPPFVQIVRAWRAARGWHKSIPADVITAPADRQTYSRFVDPAVAADFCEFHRRLAVLRIITAKANIALGTTARRPRIRRPVVLP